MSAIAVGAVAGAFAFHRHFSSNSDHDTPSLHETSEIDSNAKNVGILAMEVYTPSTYVDQSKLEEHCGVSKGKYTLGLGQEGLALCGDSEDINSICLTAVHSLMEKYHIDPSEVGRLEVGTETLVDKSKSTKTILMDLFSGNTDMEGATVVNACYGGTAALFNAFAWCESDGWDGRFAIVVAADIAAYAKGPARPTCGAGAVAILVGRDAPLAFNPKEKATHASNTWDFFKPDHTVEYPTVNGTLSQTCYYQALEDVYSRFVNKMEKNNKRDSDFNYNAESPDYWVFHAPYNKLVQKSYGRLFLVDAIRRRAKQEKHDEDSVETIDTEEKKDDSLTTVETELSEAILDDWLHYKAATEEVSGKCTASYYTDKGLEKMLKQVSSQAYEKRLADANRASQMIGNTYTASVFFGLASLIDRVGGKGELTPGKSIVLFSYGSGSLASMYRLHVRQPTKSRFQVGTIADNLKLMDRLESREEVHPSELDYALETRARMHRSGAPYSPVYPTTGRLFPGTYYLNGVDSGWRRTYSRVPLDALCMLQPAQGKHNPLAPPIVLRMESQQHKRRSDTDTTVSQGCSSDQHTKEGRKPQAGPPHIATVITGTSAGLPGGNSVFQSNNLGRLVEGDHCIAPVSGTVKMAMLEKNVVQIMKAPNGGRKRVPVDTESKVVKLAGQLGHLSLPEAYGVPPALAETMDVAAQLAVAAGLEALKSAGLVTGRSNDPNEWKLPEQYRDSTGVVYASSFPAMDAAVGEVMRFLKSKTVGAADSVRLVTALRSRVIRASPDRELSHDDEAAFARLLQRADEVDGGCCQRDDSSTGNAYEFDRKFLFRVLVLGNAQLAQLAGCRGPNTQTNGACAGTTQAVAMAQDMLNSGRADRVVVVAGDNASGPTLMPWLGSGFRALGAATIEGNVEDAACPFDKRRSGMILGAGGIGLVLETEASSLERQNLLSLTPSLSTSLPKFEVRARLVHTQYSNSAYHGAALDRSHIGSELKRFLTNIEIMHGISKAEIATHGVYFSHETGTNASASSSCAANEVAALRDAFGSECLSKLLILNTKGYTGHAMGVSFEDVAAVEVLLRQTIPAMPNFKQQDDEAFGGSHLNIPTKSGPYACRYALRFSAGFGSQVAFALYASAQCEI